MKKKVLIKINKKPSNKNKIKKEDEFWEDNFEINEEFQNYNINTNKHKNNIKNKNNIKDINSSIIINKALNSKIKYNNYFSRIKCGKKLNNKINSQKCKSAEKNRFNKLYLEGLVSIKKRIQKSMEQKIKKENEYKKYSFSPKLYTHSPIKSNKKNENKHNKHQSIDYNKNNNSKYKNNDIYERNKKWKKNIEDKKTKQRILKKKNTELKRKVKPMINDCIMKTDESFINKNSIEYQAFIDKVNIMKNKENIYGKNERNSNLYKNNKIKYSIELKKRNIIKNNKIKEMKKFKSFNNREIYNINICRKKYGLNEFFNSNNYETILCQNNDKNNFNYNNKFLIDQRGLDMNEQFFMQQIFKSSETDSINTINSIMRQSCFNFNDALKKLAGKIN